MIPLLILLMLRKSRIPGIRNNLPDKTAPTPMSREFRMVWIVCLFLLLAILSRAQNRHLSYNVVRDGKVIGQLNFLKTSLGNSTRLTLESEVKIKFIFAFIFWVKEETFFHDGILTFSSIYRKKNGKENANKQTKLEGAVYQIKNKGKTEQVDSYPIRFNLLSLYCWEPNEISKVYSDIFQQFVPVEKVGEHVYKVTLPDGNYNYYYYKICICARIEVHQLLYSAEVVLKNQVF